VKKCEGVGCAESSAIDKWMTDNQVLLLLGYNKNAYNTESYGDEAISSWIETHIMYLSPDFPQSKKVKLTQANLQSDETFFNPGWFDYTNKDFLETKFDNKDEPANKQTPLKLMVLLDNQSISYTRNIQSVLNWLGDIGGLNDALRLVGQFLVSLLIPGSLMNSLLSRLFFV
jgi:hypothetical protein